MTKKQFYGQYEQLKGGTDNYATAGTREAWERRFIKKKYDIFVRVCDYFIDKGDFPQVSDAVKQYEYFAKKGQASVQNVFKIPDQVMAMTEDEQEGSYQEIKSFMEAYPMPNIPLGASVAECDKIESEYDKLMGRHGINPKEFTNQNVGQRLVRDLLDQLPALKPRSGSGMNSMEKRRQSMLRKEQETSKT